MKTSQDRFFHNTVTKRFRMDCAPGEFWDVPYDRYGYESCNAIYDVDIRKSDGHKTYHVNMGFETEPNAHHRAIEKHFGI